MVDTIGTSHIYLYDDGPRKNAYTAMFQDWYPIGFLNRVLSEGSDLAVYWALRKIAHQTSISGLTYDNGKFVLGAHAKRLEALGGLIDDKAKATIKNAVLKAERSASDRTKVQALKVITELGLAEDALTFLKEKLQRDNPPAITAAIISNITNCRHGEYLCRSMGIESHNPDAGKYLEPDPKLDDAIWNILSKAAMANVRTACLGYLWLIDKTSVSEDKQRLLETLAESTDDSIRKAVAAALGDRAVPKNPGMIDLALHLAADDKDEDVRCAGILALRNVKTPEITQKLIEFFKPEQPGRVRMEALDTLEGWGEHHWDILIAASKDKDEWMRKRAMYHLRDMATPEAIAALKDALHDSSKMVRDEAAEQLEWMRKEGKLGKQVGPK